MAAHPAILSLCTGIGRLETAIEELLPDAQIACYVERDVQTAEVLVQAIRNGALQDAPVWSDLTTFDCRAWRGLVDILVAGFPCQPASVAGKRLGTADERWLWDHIARIIGRVGPRVIILENVPGLFVRGIDGVLGSLASLGFHCRWTTLRAADIGAPHRRERIFILAVADTDELQPRRRDEPAGPDEARSGGTLADDGSIGRSSERTPHDDDGDHASGHELDGRDAAVVDSAESGREGRRELEGPHQWLPFPPGPTDFAAWQWVLARWPLLAPAECSLRGVADGRSRPVHRRTGAKRSAQDAGKRGSEKTGSRGAQASLFDDDRVKP